MREVIEQAQSLVNRAHNAIGTGHYSRSIVRQWLRQADELLSEVKAHPSKSIRGGE